MSGLRDRDGRFFRRTRASMTMSSYNSDSTFGLKTKSLAWRTVSKKQLY